MSLKADSSGERRVFHFPSQFFFKKAAIFLLNFLKTACFLLTISHKMGDQHTCTYTSHRVCVGGDALVRHKQRVLSSVGVSHASAVLWCIRIGYGWNRIRMQSFTTFNPNTNADTNLIWYKYKMDSSNSDSDPNMLSIWSIVSSWVSIYFVNDFVGYQNYYTNRE